MDMTGTHSLLWLGVLVGMLAIVAIAGLRSQRSVKRVSQSTLSRLPEVSCSKCGQQMEEGFVAIGGMSWRPFGSSPRKTTGSGEKLKNTGADQVSQVFTFGIPENRAFRCSTCSLVLVDHNQLYVFRK
jgi:hypothetical protein